MRALEHQPHPGGVHHPVTTPSPACDHPQETNELTRLIASIIVSAGTEVPMHETKVTMDHLKRDAYLYVRQSSPRQVTEHNESTQLQYALRNRAIAQSQPVGRSSVFA
jgi:hypothetical protein